MQCGIRPCSRGRYANRCRNHCEMAVFRVYTSRSIQRCGQHALASHYTRGPTSLSPSSIEARLMGRCSNETTLGGWQRRSPAGTKESAAPHQSLTRHSSRVLAQNIDVQLCLLPALLCDSQLYLRWAFSIRNPAELGRRLEPLKCLLRRWFFYSFKIDSVV
jgi:hypothetical protein